MRKYIILIAIIGVILGLPTIALGGSFVSSLIQGKTPSEAVSIIAEQIDSLFGRVSNLETEQTAVNLEIERLKLENENLRLKADTALSETAGVRTNETRKAQCTSLANQIYPKEDAVKQPFISRITPLNAELRDLQIQRANTKDMSAAEFSALKEKMDSKRKEIDTVTIEMEQAVEAFRATPEIKSLLDKLNELLCA
jgi:chromosome segregation ATPase